MMMPTIRQTESQRLSRGPSTGGGVSVSETGRDIRSVSVGRVCGLGSLSYRTPAPPDRPGRYNRARFVTREVTTVGTIRLGVGHRFRANRVPAPQLAGRVKS